MLKLFKLSGLFLFFLCALLVFNAQQALAQGLNGAKRVSLEKNKGIPFAQVDVQRAALPATQHSAVRKSVTAFQTFDLPASFYSNVKEKGYGPIALTLPISETENVTLELVQVNNLFEGNIAKTSSGQTITGDARSYQGIIKGDEKSYAAICIFDNEVAGIFSNSSGNYVVGRLRNEGAVAGKNYQVVYNDRYMTAPSGFACKTADTPVPPPATTLKGGEEELAPEATKCVRLYVEAEYDFVQHVGSVSATQSYLFVLMNNTATLYQNTGVTVLFSTPFIWSSPDTYVTGSTNSVLTEFADKRRYINGGYFGALGILVCYRNNASEGLAGAINGLCSGISRDRLCVMFGNSNTAGLPTYNRNAKIMAHEFGHLMGSQHTHACVWGPGNNVRIDACGGNENGCGDSPGIPAAGTIMSYCDQPNTSTVNFALGFGQQPGLRIFNTVNAATCIAFDNCSGLPCFTPQDVTASFNAPNWIISWAPVPGASSFTVEYKNINSPTWITAPQVTGNSWSFGGLDPGVTFQVRVKANCANSGTTAFAQPVSFTGVSWCMLPSSLGATPSSTSAVLTWATNASTSLVQYKPVSSGTWINFGIVSGGTATITGLSPNTAYDWKITPQCQYVVSPGYAVSQFTTTPGPCNAPANLSTYNTIMSWSPVPGAVSYTLEYKPASESTWFVNTVTDTFYNLVGASGTLYDWRVKTVCNPNTSSYSTAQFYTPGKCGNLSDLTNTNITTTGATVGWVLQGDPNDMDHLQLEYKPATSSTWSSVDLPLTATSYTFTGLNGGTTYQWRIRPHCGKNASYLPSWYSSSSFTTTFVCTDPTGLLGVRLGCCGDVQLSWNAVPGALNYRIEYKKTTETNWTLADAADPYTSIELFLSSGTYNWQVRANCNGGSSGYAASTVTSFINWHCCGLDKSIVITGVKDKAALSVLPQPASKNLTVRYFSLTEERTVISLTDPSGRPQIRQSNMMVKGMNTIQLDVSRLKSGLYILTAGTEKTKVIIQQ